MGDVVVAAESTSAGVSVSVSLDVRRWGLRPSVLMYGLGITPSSSSKMEPGAREPWVTFGAAGWETFRCLFLFLEGWDEVEEMVESRKKGLEANARLYIVVGSRGPAVNCLRCQSVNNKSNSDRGLN